MPSPRSRRLAAGVWAMLPLAGLLAASALLTPPSRLPTQWGAGGDVDAVGTGAAVLSTALTVTVVAVVAAALVAGLRGLVDPQWSRVLLAGCGGVGAGATATYVLSVVGLRVSGSADAVGVWWPLAMLPVALGWAWAGWVLHGQSRPDRDEVWRSVPELDRVLPARAAQPPVELPWSSATGSSSLRGVSVLVALIFVLTAVLLAASGSGWRSVLAVTLVGAGTTAVIFALIRVEVIVDSGGLRVRSQRLPVTLLRVRAGDVLGVQATDLDPMVWGGWGLRWLPGSTAYIGSGGPGIVVHRSSGRRLAVELAEGEQAAAAGAAALRAAAAQALAGTASSS